MSTTSRRCSGGSARPSYTLLLKRCRELEEARVFNNWLGERRRRLDDMSAPTGGRSCRIVPLNGIVLRFGAHFQAPGLANQTAGTADATPEAGNSGRVSSSTAGPTSRWPAWEVLLESTLTMLGNFLLCDLTRAPGWQPTSALPPTARPQTA